MPQFKDYFQLHFIVLIWGFTAILGLLIHLPSVELVFYRTLIAIPFLMWVVYAKRRSFKMPSKELLKVLGTGVVIAAHWVLFFGAAKVSTASVCLAGMTTGSLWTGILEPIFFKRKINSYEIILGLVIIFGLYIIFQFETNHILGLSMAIASAFLSALFSVINGRLITKHDHFVLTFYEMIGANLGIVLFFPFYAIWMTSGQGLQLFATPIEWFYILILSGVCTVYAYSIGVKLMKKFTPFAINLTVNLEPVYGIVLAFLIFGEKEKMTTGFYMGTLVILMAVLTYPMLKKYFSQIQQRRALQLANRKVIR
jgi:drug/metabolite transporter (DMT)-like permease